MRNKILLYVIVFITALSCNDAFALSPATRKDSIATTLRLNGLQTKSDKLQNEIKAADAKRNKQITGVSPGTLEAMNERQDSICLALRSELVDVILEIKELSPGVTSPVLLQQYNNLVGKPEQSNSNSNTTTSQPAVGQPAKKPEK